MQVGRLGSIIAMCIGLGTAGAGMIWPNNEIMGWGLIVVGIVIAIFAIAWFFLSGRTAGTASRPISEASVGDISLKVGDQNKFGNVGHTITRTSQPER